MRRTDIMKIHKVLRHHHEHGWTLREIASATGVAKSTVSDIIARSKRAGIDWPFPGDEAALQTRLYPPVEMVDPIVHEPDWDLLIRQLNTPRKRCRVKQTRMNLWEGYCGEAVETGKQHYSYSRFCALLHGRMTPGKAAMHFNFDPGEFGFADFSGKTLAVHDADGVHDVEIFVAVLPASRLTYVEAVTNQSARCWSMANVHALNYFGGVPVQWRIDNLKAGVTKNSGETVILNPSFQDFANHYDLAVTPTLQYSPTHKAAVETAVKAIQNRILLKLQDRVFLSIEDINEAIAPLLDDFNTRKMARQGVSRRALFEHNERKCLRDLPTSPWQWAEWFIGRKAGLDYHVRHDHNNDSVPHGYCGQVLDLRVTDTMVEIYKEVNGERVASHKRQHGRHQYSTFDSHMPENHRRLGPIHKSNYGAWLQYKAKKIGPHALSWTLRCMASRDHKQQAYRTVRGMIRLAEETYGNSKVNEACRDALALNRLSTGYIRERVRDAGTVAGDIGCDRDPLPIHDNIRGPQDYERTGT